MLGSLAAMAGWQGSGGQDANVVSTPIFDLIEYTIELGRLSSRVLKDVPK